MEYLLIVLAYFVGAIPMSIIVGKLTKGVDIRDYGSGNPGTTNAIRVLGRPLGMVVFLLDVLKGGFVIFLIRIGLFELSEVFHP
ncbi:MAG: glycerol-3-phosphate acyltransferase, partial [Bacillota bacterium]